jgi:two-component system LytT family response regulator
VSISSRPPHDPGIVDDEEPARERLLRLLAEAGGVEIVGEADDGARAMEQIAALAQPVVFLDIQMPGGSGLEVASSLGAPRPRIIFCTAFEQPAVDAFELNAADYLLKPVNRARLQKALDRVRGATPDADQALDRAVRVSGAPTRFLARRGTAFRVVPSAEVLGFLSEGGLTKLQAAGQHYWMQPTLNDLEERLDPRQFFRISRAAMVSLDAVRDVTPLGGGQGEVTLSDGTRLEVGRRRFGELTTRLSGGVGT